jgi:hypothetical protein
MDSSDTDTRVITAVLPSGMPIKVEIAQPGDDEDEMASVGLRDLELGKALDSLGEIASLVVEKLKAAKPTKATVQLGLAFSVEAGKLTALWVGGQGNASLNVTMEWSAPPVQPTETASLTPVPPARAAINETDSPLNGRSLTSFTAVLLSAAAYF